MRPVSRLFEPPTALAGCVFVGIYRDTRGANLSDQDRFNHFPASPLVSASITLHGTLRLVTETGPSDASPLPRIVVLQPQNDPTTSWAESDVTALSVGIYPDAWRRLDDTGAVQVALEAFAQAPDPEVAWQAFCSHLQPAWHDVRPVGWPGMRSLSDWTRAVLAHAARSGTGRSLRSIERRIKGASGQSRRALEFYSSIEALHKLTTQNPGMPLAEMALDAGYSDQSHMGRAVRRATGFSPAQLNKAIETDEAFWCYRLLGERF